MTSEHFDDTEYIHQPRMYQDSKSGKWIVQRRWTTDEYDTEKEACLDMLTASYIPAPKTDNSAPEPNIPKQDNPKVQYDSEGKDGMHWFIQGRWLTEWYETEEEARRDLFSFTVEPDDDDYETEIKSPVLTSSMFEYINEPMHEKPFHPEVQYDPEHKDYVIVGRWKTYRFETEKEANLHLLTMSCEGDDYEDNLTDDYKEEYLACFKLHVEYDPIGKDDKHWFVKDRWHTEWFETKEEANHYIYP